jgi:hypothetical protein
MQTPLQQQLVATQSEHLLNLWAILIDGSDEGTFRLVRLAMEVTELTA